MRIGQGYDAHRFQAGEYVVLGGVKIPFDRGLAAHSDGDVLIHAVCDAILGALALGDIGKHFPDTSEEYRGVDSRTLLSHVTKLMQERDFSVVNIDATLIAEKPKMAPFIDEMRGNIASDTAATLGQVSVKATTTEKMGFTGRGEGIAATAVVLLDGPSSALAQ
ncbi:MAG: 2-C-methyl-D-erythritol 2,4-cyclodiphosphate synthase [Pseudomonadota bacterium]